MVFASQPSKISIILCFTFRGHNITSPRVKRKLKLSQMLHVYTRTIRKFNGYCVNVFFDVGKWILKTPNVSHIMRAAEIREEIFRMFRIKLKDRRRHLITFPRQILFTSDTYP